MPGTTASNRRITTRTAYFLGHPGHRSAHLGTLDRHAITVA